MFQKERKTELPLIALHKPFVTVRQIFSDDPAMKDRAIFHASAVHPFPFSGCTTWLKGTDEDRTSIKRFNFYAWYHAKKPLSMGFYTLMIIFGNFTKNLTRQRSFSVISPTKSFGIIDGWPLFFYTNAIVMKEAVV